MKKWLIRLTVILLVLVCLCSALLLVRRTSLPDKLREGDFRGIAASVYHKLDHLADKLREFEFSDLLPWKEKTTENGLPQLGGKGSGIVNILLIGQDRRPGEEDGRSDSMILCTFRPRDKTLVMTSFLRDLYVKIPGHGSNRINAAYRFGGAELLKDTLYENFGLVVDGTVEVDFSQFSTIIDVLGGVTLELRADEAAEINRQLGSSLSEGSNTLTGKQALVYARIRKLDANADFSRTNRQRKVLSAVLDQVRQAQPKQLLELMEHLLPYVDTDIGYFTALRVGFRILPMLKGMKMESCQIPADGEYQGRMIDGMSVLVPDLPKTRETLKNTLLP